jgi:putative ABC transport system substrate-binding protein
LRRKDIEVTAKALQLKMQSFEVSTRDDFDGAFQAALKERATAFTVTPDPVFMSNRQRILSFAAKNHLSAIYPWKEYVEDGGLMSYAPKLADNYRRAATYVDKILKGTKPAELPVEQPTTFELVINLRAAKQIDLTIPQRVLLKADKVIK